MTRPAGSTDVIVLGAGPYGLAAAAHLRAAGVEPHVFGRTMAFWRERMPQRMALRSIPEASSIADPHRSLTLREHARRNGGALAEPVPIADFVAYGEWFAQQAVPDVDPRRVARVAPAGDGFEVTLEDGEAVGARRVVVAAGLYPFAAVPPALAGLPPELVSHSSEHRDFGRFAGRRVLVVGGGQSALESAALLSEDGAEVDLVLRAPGVRWLSPRGGRRTPVDRLLRPPSDVGPPGLNWLVYFPALWRQVPRRQREWVAYRCIRPAAAAWLRERTARVTVHAGRSLARVEAADGRVAVTLDDGSRHVADHVLAATGFEVDVARYEFLARALVRRLEVSGGYPVLRRGYESSVPGLHFLGAPAARSFGPLMRFVAGTRHAGPALCRAVTGRRSRR